jgi:hypothetical protein
MTGSPTKAAAFRQDGVERFRLGLESTAYRREIYPSLDEKTQNLSVDI